MGKFEGIDLSVLDDIGIPTLGDGKTIEDFKNSANVVIDEKSFADEIGTVNSINDLETAEEGAPAEGAATEGATTAPPTESPYKVWAEFAAENGFIDPVKPEDFEDTPEFFVRKLNEKADAMSEKGITDWIASLPPVVGEILKNYKEGVPLNRLIDIESNIQEYSKMTAEQLDTNMELAKQVVEQFINKDGLLSPEDVAAEIQEAEDTNTLVSKAKRFLPKLVELQKEAKNWEIQEAQRAQGETKRKYDEWYADLKRKVETTDEIIPGFKLDETAKTRLLNSMTKIVGKDSNGRPLNEVAYQRMKNPAEFDMKVAYLASVLGFDFSAIERAALSKATGTLRTIGTTPPKPNKLGTIDMAVVRNFLKKR